MEIWLRQNKKSFRFAILPSEYELTSESDNTQVNINKLGEINLIGKRKLKAVSFSSIFPKQKYSFCQYSTFPTPKESVKTIEKMKNNGVLSLTMTGTPINSTTYTVKKGDCLSMIAKNLTGSSANWRAIYNQNKGVIGGNPNLIYPGQNLVINV